MASQTATTQRRILFVGNSLTSYRAGSLDACFREWGFDAHAHIKYGATLAEIWSEGGWEQRLNEGRYEIVAIQDDLPEYSNLPNKEEHWRELYKPFIGAVKKFVRAIKNAGATPILFMAHPYCRLPKTQLEDIVRCHRKAAEELEEVAIAPGAIAHHIATTKAMEQIEWSLQLLEPDREHPSVEGNYLHACTVAVSLGRTEALEWAPDVLEPELAAWLREVAVEAVKEWQEAG